MLTAINGNPLPGPNPGSDVTEITSGSLTLHADGRLQGETVIRCKSNLPAGTTCQIHGDGRMTFEGSYSRTEGWVQFGSNPWDAGGVRYPAEFASGALRITTGLPPSQGFSPRHTLDYRR